MSTIQQLKKSAELIKKNRPSYQDILGFYEQVFEAQEKSKQDISIPLIRIESDILSVKKDNDMPLIDVSRFRVDTAAATTLLTNICNLAQTLETDMSKDAQKIKEAIQNRDLNPEKLFSAILDNSELILEQQSEKIDMPVSKLIMFAYLCMAPSITVCARQLASYLDKEVTHNQGYCPICGNQPDLAFLDEDGKRHLKCCFCSHQWVTKRMGCSYCQNSDPDKQHYLYSDDEKEYRVNLCDACGNYIKVVDLRQMNRYFYPGLELISTLHLDLKAKENGYVSSVSR